VCDKEFVAARLGTPSWTAGLRFLSFFPFDGLSFVCCPQEFLVYSTLTTAVELTRRWGKCGMAGGQKGTVYVHFRISVQRLSHIEFDVSGVATFPRYVSVGGRAVTLFFSRLSSLK